MSQMDTHSLTGATRPNACGNTCNLCCCCCSIPLSNIFSLPRAGVISARASTRQNAKIKSSSVPRVSMAHPNSFFLSLSPYIIEKGNETGESFEVEERASKSSLHPNCPETNGVRDLNGRAPRNGFCRFQSTRQKFSKSRLWRVV